MLDPHLADFIKARGRVRNDSGKSERLEFYEEELSTINPNKLIVLGEKIYLWAAICKSFLNLKNVKLLCAPHYAYRFKKREELEKDFLASILHR